MGRLKSRIETLQTLAGNTDGMAVVNTNDLETGVKRISDDLTSYYLMGYYSSNSRLDGRFRSIKVRVKQPGVDVRARRGYRAATDAEVTAARKAADAPVPDLTRAVQAAVGRLDGYRPDLRFRINAVASRQSARTVWVAGELLSAGRPDEFAQGAIADIEVMSGTNSAGTARVTLKPGERTFLATVSLSRDLEGDVDVRARLAPVEGTPLPLADGVRLPAESAARPLYFRRGPTTGNRWLPAADLRFSRTERVRIEIPVTCARAEGGGGQDARSHGPAPSGCRHRHRTHRRHLRPAVDHGRGRACRLRGGRLRDRGGARRRPRGERARRDGRARGPVMAAMRRDILGIAGAVAVATLIATPTAQSEKPRRPSSRPGFASTRTSFASTPTR